MQRGFENEAALDEALSRPSAATIELMSRLKGDILVLGVAGKMGLTLARMAVRAAQEAGVKKRVVGVARFSDADARNQLEACGVETIQCDLLDRHAVMALPRLQNAIFMAGRKFGTGGSEDVTWAMNTLVPANVCEHLPESRIVAFSTGCVYPLVTATSGGCDESVPPVPVGEYAQSCLGRERVFEYYSRKNGTPVCLYRLNYAIDMRYGVLHDIGAAIIEGRPVDASVGVFNMIWQGDANNRALLCLDHCASPAAIMNITGTDILSTRDVAETLGRLLDKPVTFQGQDRGVAYLNNAARAARLFGPSTVSNDDLIQWQADWLLHGGRSLGKPTHFEVNNGKF